MENVPIIEVEHLTAGYKDFTLFNDISFHVNPGEIFVILGGSGCGKSTLLKQMTGLLKPINGSIKILGRDIPSAGLKQRLEAGANVVTSIVPPGEGLAGVAQHSLDIEEGKRNHASVLKVLEASGLRTATNDQYLGWIKSRQQAIGRHDSRRKIAC